MTRALKLADSRIKLLQSDNSRLEAEKETLQIQQDASMEWYTIKRVAGINKIDWREISWQALKTASIAMNKQIHKIFDVNYGSVNAYHISVFKKVYPDLRYC